METDPYSSVLSSWVCLSSDITFALVDEFKTRYDIKNGGQSILSLYTINSDLEILK
jgi:hypothetical protein